MYTVEGSYKGAIVICLLLLLREARVVAGGGIELLAVHIEIHGATLGPPAIDEAIGFLHGCLDLRALSGFQYDRDLVRAEGVASLRQDSRQFRVDGFCRFGWAG